MPPEQIESPTITPSVAVTSAAQAPTVISGTSADDLVAARNLVLQARPNAITEMVTGNSLTELLASADAATAAYERIVSNLGSAAEAAKPATPAEVAPVVPAGGAAVVSIVDLSPSELIRRGLVARRAQVN